MAYIFFVYGLSFLLLATMLLGRRKQVGDRLPWVWLGWFALLHGINEWLDMLAVTLGDTPAFGGFRLVVMAVSFIPLLEFARLGAPNQGIRMPGRWIWIPILILAGSGAIAGINGLNASCRYALGLPGGLLGGWVLGMEAKRPRTGSRWPLVLASVGLMFYGLATGLVVPKASYFPASVLNHASFLEQTGVPIQLIRTLCTVVCTIGLWMALIPSTCSKDTRCWFRRRVIPTALALMLASVLGALTVLVIHQTFLRHEREDQIQQTQKLARSLDHQIIDRLQNAAIGMAENQWIRRSALGELEPDHPQTGLLLYATSINFRASLVYVMDAFGDVVACTKTPEGKTLTGSNFAFRPYFTQAMRGKTALYPALGVVTGVRGLYSSAPIYAETHGEVIGVLVIKVSTEEVEQILAEFSSPTALMSPQGVIFSTNQPGWLYKRIQGGADSSSQAPSSEDSQQFAGLDLSPLKPTLDLSQDWVFIDGRRHGVTHQSLRLSDSQGRSWELVTLRDYHAIYPTTWISVGVAVMLLLALVVFLYLTSRAAHVQLAMESFHSREFLDSTLRSIGDGVISTDAQGLITSMNPVAQSLTGWSVSAAMGQPIDQVLQLIDSRSRLALPSPVLQVLTFGKIVELPDHCAVIQADGSERQVSDSCAPIRDADGAIIGAVMVFRDVTNEYRIRQELSHSRFVLEQILEQSMAGYWDWNLADDSEYLSPTFKLMFGYQDDELPNSPQTWQRLIFPQDLTKIMASFERHVASHGEEQFKNIVRYRHKNGSTVWVLCSGKVVAWSPDGKPLRMVGCHVDITQIKLAQYAAQESEMRFRTMADAAPALLWTSGTDAKCNYFNRGWLQYTGRTMEQEMGDGWTENVHPDDLARCLAVYRQAFDARQPFQMTYRLRRHDGEYRWMIDRGSPNVGTEGIFHGYVGMLIDIHEQRQIEQALQESEAKFRTLYESSPVAIARNRMSDGKFLEANSAFTTMTGYTADDLPSLSYFDITPPEYLPDEAHQLDELRIRGAYGPYEKEYIRKDGSRFPVLLSGVLAVDAQGHEVIWSIIQDISERKRAERALSEKSTILAELLRSIPDLVFFKDRQGVYLGCNPEFVRFVGKPESQIIGFTDYQLFSTEVADFFRVQDRAMMEQGGPRHNDEWVMYPDGRRVLLDTLKAPLRTADGEIIGMVGVSRDITTRQQHEMDLRESNRRLEETTQRANELASAAQLANIAKSQFLANMSHEIRTPMTAILGYADVLAEQLVQPDLAEYIATIKRNGNHLLALINDILDLSKIEAGKMSPDLVVCSPHQIVAEIGSLVMGRARSKDLYFNTEFVGHIPQSIRTDPLRLRQILVNLIGNSIKFTQTGGVRMVVRCLDNGENSQLQFDVIDTGIGMTAQQAERIFQPFGQADSSTTRQFGGTGLGLTISKRLAYLLGGDVVLVESKAGVGTCFRATVCIGSIDNVPVIEDAVTNQQAVVMAHSKPQDPTLLASKPLQGLRLLLVEDGPDNQRLIMHLLKKAGAQVDLAQNGREGMDQALAAQQANAPHDLVLMDMQMPEVDGYEATRRLRAVGYLLPIIALTAHAMSDDRKKCIEAGCDDYTTKPIDRASLVRIILRFTRNNSLPLEPLNSNIVLPGLANSSGSGSSAATLTVEQFAAQLPARLASIHDALDRQQLDTLEILAHQLKGAAGSLGLDSITAVAALLEQDAKSRESLTKMAALTQQLAELCKVVASGKSSAPSA